MAPVTCYPGFCPWVLRLFCGDPFQILLVGVFMKVSLHFKDSEQRQLGENEVARHLPKLEKWLRSYEPDLVQLHGSFEKHLRKAEYTFSLNLSLPTGTLHVTRSGADTLNSVKQVFAELEMLIKKHQAKLRKDYEWKRKRARRPVPA